MEEFKIDKTIRFTLCLHMAQKIVRNWKLALKRNGIKASGRLQIGPTIGTHVGPGAFGVCFVEEF